ncbi:transposase [Streptomyces sp. NPDC058694]|uniref:transposase n=1 Tax=Streptomyces sp. NPDC058694 TaxID=3346603 RepID=UPI003662BF65
MADFVRPPGGGGEGGAGGEGLGRSRGGFTSKLHLSAHGRCRPLSLTVTPGQRADRTQFKAVLEQICLPRIGPGRPRNKPRSLAADKAYSNGPCREYLRRRGVRHTIPEKADSKVARLLKGSRGGRPPGFDNSHDLLAYAGQLAVQPSDAYLSIDLNVRPTASPAEVLQAVTACGGLLEPEGFAAMGVAATLLHTYDNTQGLSLDWLPPAPLSAAVLNRLFWTHVK